VRLLDRVGINNITSHPVWLKKNHLDKEKLALIEFLRKYI